MAFFEQASWWSHQDVVISAHGAGLMNLIFMKRDAGIVEIFPQHFYEMHYFKTLSQSADIRHHLQWINSSVSNPEADYQKHFSTDKYFKTRDVEPPVEEIISLVEKVLGKYGCPCYFSIQWWKVGKCLVCLLSNCCWKV